MHRIRTSDPQTILTTDYTDEDRIEYTRDQRSAGGARFVVTCLTFEIRELEAPATLATDL